MRRFARAWFSWQAAIGAYGFLAKAHIGHAVDGDVAMASVAAEFDANVAVHTGIVADLERRIAQIDHAVEVSTAKGRTKSAMELAADQRKPAPNWVHNAPLKQRRSPPFTSVHPRLMEPDARSRRISAP